MRNTLKLIASPRNLFVFEAAARLGSFTLAASDLGMQQPSVSAAIKQLERSLGVRLFDRGHRRITLTNAGLRFYADVSQSLRSIESAAEAVHNMGNTEYVTLNSSSAFSFYWMMPKLHRLREFYPAIDLRLQNSVHEPDLDAENISIAVRLGDGNWPECHVAKIADEIIFPVASPKVMRSARNLRSIPNLLNERLIHLEEPVRMRPTWKQWFEHHGVMDVQISEGLRLNDYALVLQAAQNGEGIAFGWQHIVSDLVDKKLLAARDDWAWQTSRGVYLVWSKSRPLSDNAEVVRDWILSFV
ncbi:transcriptional regulator [Chromatiales bacterium (ex Bugula neritina AB1)]|nr:transcriptional regulator [Chromatiales bacterium (ex Bugula neritina AB1)]